MTLFQKIMKFLHDFFMPNVPEKPLNPMNRQNPFPDINVDAIAKELELRKKAMQDGKNENPTSDQIDFSEAEKEIVALMKRFMDDASAYIENQITTYSKDIHSKIDSLTQKVANIKNEASFAIESHKISEIVEYEKYAKESYNDLRAYNTFRNNYKITRDPKPSTSSLAFWGPILLIFVIEIIINAFLFSENSEYGFIGGIAAIALFSLVNIILGLITGRLCRVVHYPQPAIKILGWISFLVFICLVLTFNIFTGHYRYLYTMYGEAEATKNALQSMITSPALTDVYSIILCILGTTFALFASYKAYFKTDPIYGYDDLHKKLIESEKLEEENRTNIVEKLNTINKNITDEVKSRHEEFKNISLRVNSSVTRASRNDREYKIHINEINDALTKLLKLYRSINEEHRTTKTPSYFTKTITLDEYKIPESTSVIQAEVEEFNQKYNEALNEMKKSQNAVASTLDEALANIKAIQTKYSNEVISYE